MRCFFLFYSVDRIVDGTAVCIDDNGDIYNISLDLIAGEIKEGSVLKITDDNFLIDVNEENARRESNFDLAESLFEN